jgi:predicted RNase H-like HicB family nuclease
MASTRVSQIVRKPYARIIVPDDQGGYAAQVLEFPGCFADGESPEEAYSNLEEVAESWVESALAQGFPVPPPVATQGHSGTVSLRLPKSLHKRAAELAHRDGVSLNQFLVAAIAARVGAENLTETIASKLDDRLDKLGLQRMDEPSNLTVDAAELAKRTAPPRAKRASAASRV